MTQTEDWGKCLKCGWTWPIGAGDASVYANKHGTRQDVTKPPSIHCPFCGSSKWKEFKERL